ncbi:hypothetical protein C8Q78DRAFT_1075252 [Trametes maxima]|nr:hypothetical protein C8Q78DRAFT_1075252 [Trametes maxima]
MFASPIQVTPKDPMKGTTFWLTYTSTLVCICLASLNITALFIDFPATPANAYAGVIGPIYGIAASSVLPSAARLSGAVGSRLVVLISVTIFLLGSVLAIVSQNAIWLAAARAVQGIGGGGIAGTAATSILGLLPPAERGPHNEILLIVEGLSAAMGPIVSSSLMKWIGWSSIYYLNVFVTAIALVLLAMCLPTDTPAGGSAMILDGLEWGFELQRISGTTLALIVFTWGGIQFPWDCGRVVAPLAVAGAFMALLFRYKRCTMAAFPLASDASPTLVIHRAHIIAFIHGAVKMGIIYCLPIYLQLCTGANPIAASVNVFATALIMRPPSYAGWVLVIAGIGIMSLLKLDSTTVWQDYRIMTPISLGLVWGSTMFPLSKSAPPPQDYLEASSYRFCTAFSQTWGSTISARVLQNGLKQRLSPIFLAQFQDGADLAYAALHLGTTSGPVQSSMRSAFAESMPALWRTMAILSGAGLVALVLGHEMPAQEPLVAKFGPSKPSSPLHHREEDSRDTQADQTKAKFSLD